MPWRMGVVYLVLFLACHPVFAALESDLSVEALTELSLEALMEIEVPVVYAASKVQQKITEAPGSITVITEDEIKLYGYRTLADVLRSVPGFFVSYDRNYSFLGARGVNLGDFNSRMLLLVDGHRVNNNLTDGAYIGSAFILDVDLVERVEIIRGPGSVLYGNNAFFGVINVITRRGEDVDGVEASGEYASFDTLKGRMTVGAKFTNGLEFMLSGTVYQSDGADELYDEEFDTPAQNNGIAEGLDDEAFGSFFGSVRYRDFSVEGAYIQREKGNPTAQFFTAFNDPGLRTIDTRSYANLQWEHEFPDVAAVMARVYYDQNDYEIDYPFGGVAFTEEQAGEWWGAELQINKQLWERHMVTVGGEYRDDFRQSQLLYDAGTGVRFTDVQGSRESYGVFAQGDFAVRTNLHVIGGLRYDQYGDFDPSWNPRLALIWHPVQSSTLKLLYGTAFRAPNFIELSDPRFPDVQPEEITTYELVYEQEFGRHIRSSLSGFFNRMDDLIALQDGAFTNFNAETKGVEVALEGLWSSGVRGRASYSFQDTENRSTGGGFADSPAHLVKLNLSVPLYRDKVFAGLEYLYTSQRTTLRTTSLGQTVPGESTDAFGVLNLTLFSQNLVENLELSASVYNLLDSHYGDPATPFHAQDSIEQDGRTFRIKLTYRF